MVGGSGLSPSGTLNQQRLSENECPWANEHRSQTDKFFFIVSKYNQPVSQPSLLQSLFDEQERRPLTVAELNAQVKRELEKSFSSVWVEGEITNFTSHRSGHWYFSLNGDGAQVKAACFKSTNWRIRFKPSNGLSVRV